MADKKIGGKNISNADVSLLSRALTMARMMVGDKGRTVSDADVKRTQKAMGKRYGGKTMKKKKMMRGGGRTKMMAKGGAMGGKRKK